MAVIKKRPIEQRIFSRSRHVQRVQERPLTMQIYAYARRAKKEKLRGPESPLYAATCPAFYILRVFGLAPFEFDEDQLVPSDIDMIFSFVWLFIYTYNIYFVLAEFTYVDRDNRAALRFTEFGKVYLNPDVDPKEFLYVEGKYLQAIVNYIVVIFDLLVAMKTRDRMAKVWNMIQNHDEAVGDMGYARTERKTVHWIWSMIAGWTCLWATINLLGMYAFYETWFKNISYLIIYVGTSLSMLKFSGMVFMLGQRFSDITEIAEKNLSLAARWPSFVRPTDIKNIERLFDDLMVTSQYLGSTYSLSVFIWLANASLHSVSDLFFVITWILDQGRIMFRADFICLNLWMTVFFVELFILNYACHSTSFKANRMGYIMLSWRRWLYTRDRNKVVEKSLHLLNRLHFEAAGCFDVDLPLLRAIVGLQTTYLVILLQFD